MKTKLLFLIFFAAIISHSFKAICGDGTKSNPYRIFWIGNSNTYMWGWYPANTDQAADPELPRRLKEMAEKARRPVFIENEFQMAGGKDLKWHWENDAQNKIVNGDYDFVVLNDHSTATFANPDLFVQYSGLFDSLITTYGGRSIFFMNWPDDDEWTLRRNVIINSYDSLAVNLGSELAPFGRAWEIIENTNPGLNLYQDDLHHPNELGVYMNTCVMYSVITNTPPSGIDYIYSMHWLHPESSVFTILQDVAWEACKDRLDANNEISLSSSIVNNRDINLEWTDPNSSTTSIYAVYENATFLNFTTNNTYVIVNAEPIINQNVVVLGMNSDSVELFNSNGLKLKLTDTDPPSVPTNISIFNQGDDFVSLLWDPSIDNSQTKEYIIYINGTEYMRSSSYAVEVSGLQKGTAYTLEIASVDQSNNVSEKSAASNFTLGEANSIKQEENKFFIYPNPAYDKLMVISKIGASINVFKLNGSLCSQSMATSNKTTLDISNLLPGNYIISIKSESYSKSKILIIQ